MEEHDADSTGKQSFGWYTEVSARFWKESSELITFIIRRCRISSSIQQIHSREEEFCKLYDVTIMHNAVYMHAWNIQSAGFDSARLNIEDVRQESRSRHETLHRCKQLRRAPNWRYRGSALFFFRSWLEGGSQHNHMRLQHFVSSEHGFKLLRC